MDEMGTPGEGTRPTRGRFCGSCRLGALTRRGMTWPYWADFREDPAKPARIARLFLDCSSIVALLVAMRRGPSSQKRGYLPRARFPVD